ncbi:MAG: hypothetical protein NC331_11340 [Lachnospiraceae bacterium]|nr:hypothetical protein [Lachnospiraceae bacterium]MCM1239961.1 hypothetical protein [Lachnospiraceae bacterium]
MMDVEGLTAQIKDALRIRHSALDDDIRRKIKAAVRDMEMRGVAIPDGEDDLVATACELYCKGQYDHLGQGARFMEHYESLRDSMSLNGGYNGKE